MKGSRNLIAENQKPLWWKRLGLRTRIFMILAALLLTTLMGGLVTIWHTDATDSLFETLIDKNLASFQAAEELENVLLAQKGYLTYFFLDGDPEWLKRLEAYSQEFHKWLNRARKSSYTPAMDEIIDKIEWNYQAYLKGREQVINLYQAGKREEGYDRHKGLRQQYAIILSLCERYKVIHEYAIARVRSESRSRARFINSLALLAMVSVTGLGVALVYILFKQILGPIRQLALETGPADDIVAPDEIKALSRRVHNLMEDVDLAQSQLERSQEHLLQSEKLALVGKLAAGVAHSIRNPLTSVKMRLFSLGRHLELSPTQKEDLEVISEEIRHIDNIVRSFLEFSRPPKLKMQKASLSDVVDSALALLSHRLESYGVTVEVKRTERLPEMGCDPEQLKEVLVNLILNSCDAMVDGGVITIQEGKRQVAPMGRVAFLKLSDTGPGVPPSIGDRIFQPFFSTKEEGTGLGLSIATRIIQEHGGFIELTSQKGQGAVFMITLPYQEEDTWAPS
jgi:signal transduction histidine kinase